MRLSARIKVFQQFPKVQRKYATTPPINKGRGGKLLLGIISTAGLGATGTIAYGKYDPKFKALLEDNVPYMTDVYKWLRDWNKKSQWTSTDKASESQSSMKILDFVKTVPSEVPSLPLEPVIAPKDTLLPEDTVIFKENSSLTETVIATDKSEKAIQTIAVNETALKDVIQKLEDLMQAVSANKSSLEDVNVHTSKIYEALDVPQLLALQQDFELELRQQLRRQAAAHADHLEEVLKMQQQEFDRKHAMEVEEQLLRQRGVFISEVSAHLDRLKRISAYVKDKAGFHEAAQKAQALWLACQSLDGAINNEKFEGFHPLATNIATIKSSTDENSAFIDTILDGIPNEAIDRGVFTQETLKHRFQNVKRSCKRVALIDETNDSLYRRLLSYLQSFLIVETKYISKAELEGKVAVDSSEWDTFDILVRISFCVSNDDMEQALRYANQLKGEARVVAKDWMNEVRLLLETKLAVKALLAHAAAVAVQAYH